MRVINVTLECDWPGCDVSGPEGGEEVREKELAVDRKQSRVFLLCKEHIDALDEILMPLLRRALPGTERLGTKKGTSRKPALEDGYVCKHPGCGRPIANRTGLAQHVIRSHGYKDLAVYEERFAERNGN